jgi:hypothetical protein
MAVTVFVPGRPARLMRGLMAKSTKTGTHPHIRMAAQRRREKLQRLILLAIVTLVITALSVGLALSVA